MRYLLVFLCLVACATTPKVVVTKEGRTLITKPEETDKTNAQELANPVNMPAQTVLSCWKGNEGLSSINHTVAQSNRFKSIGLSGASEYYNVVSCGKYLYVFENKGISRIDLATNKKERFIAVDLEKKTRVTLLGLDKNLLCIANGLGDVMMYDILTKKLLWSKKLKGIIRSTPVIDNGEVFIQTSENAAYAFNANTGKELWEHQGNLELVSYERGSQIAVTPTKVVIVYTSGEVVALERSSGASLWSDIILPPSEYEGHLTHIVASPVIDGNACYVLSYGQVLIAYDLENGEIKWRKNIGGIHTPLVVGNYLYVINHNNQLLAYNKNTGALRFKTALKGDGFTNLLLVNNMLTTANNKGEIYSVDPKDGKIANISRSSSGWPQELIAVQKRLVLVEQNKVVIS